MMFLTNLSGQSRKCNNNSNVSSYKQAMHFDKVLSLYFLMRFLQHQSEWDIPILTRFYRWRFRGSGSLIFSRSYDRYISAPELESNSFFLCFSTVPSSCQSLSPGLLQWPSCWYSCIYALSLYGPFFKKKLFSFGYAGPSLLLGLFSDCSRQRLLSSCRALASHCSGFSCGRAWTRARRLQSLWHVGSAALRF